MNFEEMINTIQLGDCYELIKQIPDKSIDLVYIDIPYLYCNGGAGNSELCNSSARKKATLMGTEKQYPVGFTRKSKTKKPFFYGKWKLLGKDQNGYYLFERLK